MATIGRLVAEIDADASGLQKGIKDATGAVTSAASDITQQAKNIAGAIGAYMSADLFIGFVKGSIDAAAQMGKLSQQTGIAVESLSALNYAASLNGASIQDLDGALKGLANKMLEAQMGGGEAANVFKALGIAVTDTTGGLRDTEAVLMDMADAFKGMEDGAGKAALSQKLMEDAGVALIPALNQGSDGIKAMADEAASLGTILDKDAAAQASAFNDQLTRLNATTTALGQTIGIALAPTLTQIATEFLTAMKGADDMKSSADTLRSALSGLYASGVGVATVFSMVGTTLGGVAAAVTTALTEKGGFAKAKSIIGMLGDDLDGIAQKAADSINRVSNAVSVSSTAVTAAGGKKPPPNLPSSGGAPKLPGAKGGAAQDEGDPILALIQQREQAESAYWAGRVEKINMGLMTENELLDFQLEKDLERLNNAMLTDEEHKAAMEALQLEYDARRIEQATATEERITAKEREEAAKRMAITQQWADFELQQRYAVANAAIGLLSTLGGKSKAAAIAAIALGKALSIAQIIQNTAAAQMRALAELGPIAGPPAAAKIGVMGKVQAGIVAATGLVQAASAMAGGGGSLDMSGSGVGSGSSAASVVGMNGQQALPAAGQTITVRGISSDDLFSGEAVRSLIDKLIDAQRNGARIVLA